MNLWLELGETMRQARHKAGVSLRDLESRGRWTRSTLSLAERGRSRPSRDLVDWYETLFAVDGLLQSLYFEARAAPRPPSSNPAAGTCPSDVELLASSVPNGTVVGVGERLEVTFRLRNSGHETWTGRVLERLGAHVGVHCISSERSVSVPDTAPGGEVDLSVEVTAPAHPSSVVAHWLVVDSDARSRAVGLDLCLLLVAR